MHIIIGLITAIAGFIWALHSLQNAGFDLNALNPFTWARRRKWEKQLGTKPMHALEDSMEAAALLVISIAKAEGEITRDTKMEILELFENEFGVNRSKAISLFSASSFMLKDSINVDAEVVHILSPSKSDFDESHALKLVEMMNKVASKENVITTSQQKIINAVSKELKLNEEKPKNW